MSPLPVIHCGFYPLASLFFLLVPEFDTFCRGLRIYRLAPDFSLFCGYPVVLVLLVISILSLKAYLQMLKLFKFKDLCR